MCVYIILSVQCVTSLFLGFQRNIISSTEHYCATQIWDLSNVPSGFDNLQNYQMHIIWTTFNNYYAHT